MGNKFANFKYSIGDLINDFGRNLKIINREYRSKEKCRNGRTFIQNDKYYKYKCLNCGNEDWMVEYLLGEKQHCGCNACGKAPKKVVKGINDVTTTAPWMVKYYPQKEKDACKYFKFDKSILDFVCPDCGRIHHTSAMNIYANRGLSCICSDNTSYPNKVMYSILSQSGLTFVKEKSFEWSENRIYDFYLPQNELIIEIHGNQHYDRPIIKDTRFRSLSEEKSNDKYKEEIALAHGIKLYYQIDCRKSDIEYIRASILQTDLFEILHIDTNKIDWGKCDEFATSNFAKKICQYKQDNPTISLHKIAEIFNLAYITVLSYIKKGNKFGWCNYTIGEDMYNSDSILNKNCGQKPIYCYDNGTYYRSSRVACECLSTNEKQLYPRQLRRQIDRNQTYKGYKFRFISQEEFNEVKDECPSKAIGNSFNI